MNKLLLVFLAICFISVCHAFVKRDAPEPAKPDAFQDIATKIQEVSSQMGEKMKEAIDPDTIKKNINEFIDNVSAQLNKLKPQGEAPKQ